MKKYMGLACFGRESLGLFAIAHRQVRMARGDSKVLCVEIAFRFPVMKSGFFVVVRGIVMKTGCWMFASHFRFPLVMK